MQAVRTHFQAQEPSSMWASCRTQHQAWATILTQSEQEIDQLLTLLTDLPDETYRSFSHHTGDYTQGLTRLKGKIQSVRDNMVCAGAGCTSISSAAPLPCTDRRFLPQSMSTSLVSAVAAEYDRMKDRCQSFLGELMRLNLI